ncbi:4Fe-4S dicluster domain-containing protein [Sedimentibacter sp. MB31-C6]|uniref:4Fe-4S dicluster domain-containing protein n=1 Tax=Sedimentibacter sp. MB31-C6 TaxID=3109366 RepID=UPI002DDCB89E|nr:4Fe-4S binding protein [Sedimentibacter sp. MB36-C1]WSI03191.1 4Fe-4S binding protein [Sedimentibacter sp. MB36-C1]
MKYKVNQEKCRQCKMCLRSKCPAIKFKDKIIINIEKCTGCGICYKLCPVNAIEMIDDNKY